MARITRGANMRSNTPPIPPAPSQAVEIRTSDPLRRGHVRHHGAARRPGNLGSPGVPLSGKPAVH